MKRHLAPLALLLSLVPAMVRAQDMRPQLSLQIGHMGRVNALQPSPDGRLVASASSDATAKLWDAATGELVHSLPHDAPVLAVAFRDNGVLLTASADGSLRGWNMTSGSLLATTPGRADGPSSIAAAFSPDGALAAFSAEGGKIELRETATGNLLTALAGHPTAVTALAFSPDGKTLASASAAHRGETRDEALARPSGDIRLWDVSRQKLLRVLRGHALHVFDVAWSPDGSRLVSVGESGTAVLWDARSFERLEEFNASRGRGRAVSAAFSPDGRTIVTGWSRGVASWDLNNAAGPRWSLVRSEPVSQVVVLADGRIVAGERDGSLRLIQAAQAAVVPGPGRVGGTLPGRPGGIRQEAGRPAANRPAGRRPGSLRPGANRPGTNRPGQNRPAATRPATPVSAPAPAAAETADSAPLVRTAHSRMEPLSVARVSPDGKYIASADTAGALNLWDGATGALLRAWQAHPGGVNDVAFSPDGKRLATAGRDGATRIWLLPVGRLERTIQGSSSQVSSRTPRSDTALAFAPDGRTLAIGDDAHAVRLVNLADGRSRSTLLDASGEIHSLAYSPDGRLAAATGRGDAWGQALVWGADGKLRTREFLHGVRRVIFSPEGDEWLAGGAWLDKEEDYEPAGDELLLWNSVAGEKSGSATARAPGARVLDAAYAPDGKSLATASADGTIRLWDAAGKLLREARGHSGPVRSVEFFAAGVAFATAGRDGTVRLWDRATGALRATLMTISQSDGPAAVGAPLAPEWIALTPEGTYDASPGAGRYVRWRLGNDVFPVEAFARSYHRPGALQVALRAAMAPGLDDIRPRLPSFIGSPNWPPRPRPESAFSRGSAIPPSVSILTPKAGQNATDPMQVTVSTSDDKEVRSVELLINGRPAAMKKVDADSKPLEVGAKPLEVGAKPLEVGAKPLEVGAKPLEVGAKPVPASHRRAWSLTLPATLPPADSAGLTVKALVTDDDGLQGTDEIRLKRAGGIEVFGTLRVLAVGVSTYANPAYNLKYAGADAAAFAGMWPKLPQSLFEKVEVTSLVDGAATSTAVRAALEKTARDAGPEDVVALFLSGHGVQGKPGEFFFATTDVALDRLSQTAVPWTALQNALAGSRARRIVLFLDACHSGNALGGRQAGNESLAQALVQEAGAVVFASSLGSQHSYELDALKQGVFTHALLEGIRDGKADLDAGAGRDGVINVEELLTFLRARIPQLTDNAQMPACPLLRDFGEPFPLARTGGK